MMQSVASIEIRIDPIIQPGVHTRVDVIASNTSNSKHMLFVRLVIESSSKIIAEYGIAARLGRWGAQVSGQLDSGRIRIPSAQYSQSVSLAQIAESESGNIRLIEFRPLAPGASDTMSAHFIPQDEPYGEIHATLSYLPLDPVDQEIYAAEVGANECRRVAGIANSDNLRFFLRDLDIAARLQTVQVSASYAAAGLAFDGAAARQHSGIKFGPASYDVHSESWLMVDKVRSFSCLISAKTEIQSWPGDWLILFEATAHGAIATVAWDIDQLAMRKRVGERLVNANFTVHEFDLKGRTPSNRLSIEVSRRQFDALSTIAGEFDRSISGLSIVRDTG